MKTKRKMYTTFKISLFKKLEINQELTVDPVIVHENHLLVNPTYCDLHTFKERYDESTKIFQASSIERILVSESILTNYYGKAINCINTLYDFLEVDCSGGNDNDPYAAQLKDLLCFDGIYLPLDALQAVGYVPHENVEYITVDGLTYIKYRVAVQSASENRQMKISMTTHPWASFAKTISSDAKYLYEPILTSVKAISRLGLAKTGGMIIKDFKFSYALLPDFETDVAFKARCYYDATDKIVQEVITTPLNATDGCGWISPAKAKELARKLGLSYVPSAFQIRYGSSVKGVLSVFDFPKYCNYKIPYDILFTRSMWKSDFDTTKAEFLVCNVSKPQRQYTEFNYQMFCSLNSQIKFENVVPYLNDVKSYFDKALQSPEDALKFLGLLSDINADDKEYACVEKVAAVINANPKLAMNIRWVRQSIKRKINLVAKKMLEGRVPMPYSGIAIVGADPLSFFNNLLFDDDLGFNFTKGNLVVTVKKQVKPLQAGEFYYIGYEGDLLSMRCPLTHSAQIRKLNCVSDQIKSEWYQHLNQVVIYNSFDATLTGQAGADKDGDQVFLTRLFVDKFEQNDYIIYNNNPTEVNQAKTVLTEDVMQKTVRANLVSNLLGMIVNSNSRTQELLNDNRALQRLVCLANYTGDASFGLNKKPRMPFADKFATLESSRAYLEQLNHKLTTLSELEIDRAKTGYVNRYAQNKDAYALPFMPYWFADAKGYLNDYLTKERETAGKTVFNEPYRQLCRNDNDTLVRIITDVLKDGQYGKYVQRTVDMMTDTDSVMSNIYRYIKENIIDSGVDVSSCYDITETLLTSVNLNHNEVNRIYDQVFELSEQYRHDTAILLTGLKEGHINEEEFNNLFDDFIEYLSEALRAISDDRMAIGFAAYKASTKNNNSSAFPFLCCLDGITGLLDDINQIKYYDLKLKTDIPLEAKHLIVYRKKYRLPETLDNTKTYLGSVNLPNGAYEIHRNLKGSASLIIPRSLNPNHVKVIPTSPQTEFHLKISYKASELAEEHRNGEYVSSLMAKAPIAIKEITIDGNIQYGVFVSKAWVGTVFSDQANKWVLEREVARSLIGNQYRYIGTPIISKGNIISAKRATAVIDSNSSIIGTTGKVRSAQVITLRQIIDDSISVN